MALSLKSFVVLVLVFLQVSSLAFGAEQKWPRPNLEKDGGVGLLEPPEEEADIFDHVAHDPRVVSLLDATISDSNQEAIQEKIKDQNSKLKRLQDLFPKKAAVEGLKTMALVLITACIGMVQAQIRQDRLQGKVIGPDEVVKTIGLVVYKILAGGDIWMGMAGAGAVGSIMQKPMEILSAILRNSVSKQIFAKILISGVESSIVFIGWDAGSQLWQDARVELPPEDYKNI